MGCCLRFLVDGSATREVFEYYLEVVLGPHLSEGMIVVMANYSIHKGGRVPEIAKALGIEVRHLPGYSPDLNAI